MDAITLKLNKPIHAEGTSYDELVLRELTVDENISIAKAHGDKTTAEQDKFFFALTCSVSPNIIGQMGMRDYQRLKNLYWSSLGNVEPESKNSE